MSADSFSGLMMLRRFVELAHHIPGRIRLRFTNKLVASVGKSKLSALDELCGKDNCLRSYTLNTDTGSLLLEYDAKRLPPMLLDQLFGDDDQLAQQALTQILPIISPAETQ
ncbi:HMA2 domain-containing protein [Pragia fontium]|uniref:Uncharacterized protein n=2 Tax=Pragia fontium TaxID=82985 RepID=A0AAJ5BGX9_9GAMM|nr:hypothetical protein [Pragia fontium]AKJ43095.1 hypothetical protein QQ39_14330 [Pragia fontium]SFC67175.1 hypothetical protein SAMN02745723_103269 [Pragia fontium DSM 5563 = ATCC 49100]SUB83541.1 Uncharacterised protein [Pragia fontium]VEJ56446.1 Uncharacterised protein [Pragia fontium]GKX63519.1 hypothetical protein SOASR032_20880 [Pragia fontium]